MTEFNLDSHQADHEAVLERAVAIYQETDSDCPKWDNLPEPSRVFWVSALNACITTVNAGGQGQTVRDQAICAAIREWIDAKVKTAQEAGEVPKPVEKAEKPETVEPPKP